MAVVVTTVGTTRPTAVEPGVPVRSYTLSAGPLRAEIWDLGATLVGLHVPDRGGRTANVVLRHDGVEGYDDPSDRAGYLGATIGRWANRIRDGRCHVGGRELALERNDGAHHLHGGVGFDQRLWEAEVDGDGCPDGGDCASVRFRRTSPDGEAGYPGRLEVSVRYRLTPSALEVAYEADTDAETIVNLTNHAYWNLAGGGRIDDHVVTIHADRYLPVDDGAIPVGGPAPVAGTRFDFRSARPAGPFDGEPTEVGYDHCFVPDGTGMRAVAEVVDPASGRVMRVDTDQPGLQFYTANFLDEPHTALCLETQRAPDAPNQPDLGQAVLRPGEIYRHRTVHTFTTQHSFTTQKSFTRT